MKNPFIGTGVALVTPFRKPVSIDFSKLEALINRLIANGVDYIVALGTTSEAATMTDTERHALQDFIIETVAGRCPIMLGLGGNNTLAVTDAIANTNFDGISGILSVAPYYNKPNQRGLAQHFKQIADSDTTLQLAAECPNIMGIKEASGNIAQVMQIIKNKPERFLVISGDDALTYPMMTLGAAGVISVIANALPKEMSSMVKYAQKGDLKKALPLHYRMLPLMNAIFEEGNPAGIKALLEIQGLISNNLRMPLVKVSKPLYNKLSQYYDEFNA